MAGRGKVDNAMLHWHWHTLYSTAAVGIEMQEGLLLATYPNEHFSPVDRVLRFWHFLVIRMTRKKSKLKNASYSPYW